MPFSLRLVKKWLPASSVAAPSETGFLPTTRMAAAISAWSPSRKRRLGTLYQWVPFMAPK